MVNTYRLGLVVGTFMGLIHLMWTLMIAIFPIFMQNFLNRIFELHFIQPIYTLNQTTRGKGILLVIVTFVVGFIIGMILGCLWNRFMGNRKVKSIANKKSVIRKKRK